MAPSPKPDHHLNLNYLPQLSAVQSKSGSSTADTSPIEPTMNNPIRSPFGNPGGVGSMASATGSARLGAGSPSHELGGRLYTKRAREIQAQEGLTPVWGPPASGGSTPLRETIPESPSQDGFPDFTPPAENNLLSPTRRARAGTVPSRFPAGVGSGLSSPALSQTKSSRPTPVTSPFKASVFAPVESKDTGSNNNTKPTVLTPRDTSALLSRLRAGSMPQRTSYVEPSNPFGNTLFSTAWGSGRERALTLQSIRSDPPESPAQSSFSKDGLVDTDVKTLDYLGLAETPRQTQASLVPPGFRMSIPASLTPFLAIKSNPNRFRSYSVNAKEKYAQEEDPEDYAATAAAAYAATQAEIYQHNLEVQAFVNQASASRPRARTTTVLDSPSTPLLSSGLGYVRSPLENSTTAASIGLTNGMDYAGLPEAVQALNLNNLSARSNLEANDEHVQDGPTRSLWLGSIPSSTTTSTLAQIFAPYGKIESSRVLVHKNCGFVNFESLESATNARGHLNGKEIFPGAGPCKIGYAKEQHSATATPGNNGVHPSRSPDPHTNGQRSRDPQNSNGPAGTNQANGVHARSAEAAMRVPGLRDLRAEMLRIVTEYGATSEDRLKIAHSIDMAINFNDLETEIPPVPEPSQKRMHDAPKLREIRKRIDNNAISLPELEDIAMEMLPEIAELAADYLGNTVVQKLFEFCSEPTREQMLRQLAPHLAEIGVHKNGTWAAQKIIDVTRNAAQMEDIVDSLRPYTVPLFLDQYGNYVLQGCLRFEYPYNNFVFETMLSRMWEIAQGRFGARAMRACLESHNATKDQQRMLASAISLHSVQLATNANGALLLTWLLDTCNLPRRRMMLAPRLVPHLVHLCTHKVAYLTVLKVINQRNEPEARDIILQALFFSENDKVLEDILSDSACGASLVYKILTTPFLDETLRSDVVPNIKNILTQLKVSPSQGYKRLMDEVGMSGRASKGDRDHHNHSNAGSHQGSRPGSSHNMHNSRRHQQDMDRYGNNGQTFQQQQGQRTAFQAPHSGVMPGTSPLDPLAYEQQQQQQFNPAFLPTQSYPSNLVRPPTVGFYDPNYQPPLDPTFRNMQFQQQRPPMVQPQVIPVPPQPQPMSYLPQYASFPMQFPMQQQQQQRMPNGRNNAGGGYQ
ncbi:MAG: hypothetical protein Q9195_004684 [Heterodermia aff. obscurata]